VRPHGWGGRRSEVEVHLSTLGFFGHDVVGPKIVHGGEIFHGTSVVR
jgi:hypothetical protein